MNDNLNKILAKIADLPLFEDIHPLTPNSRNVAGETPLHVAAIWGDVEAIQILVEAGADVNAKGEYGNRPLHEAIGQKKAEAVKNLIQLGALTNVPNDDGLTPLEMAKLIGSEEIKRAVDCGEE